MSAVDRVLEAIEQATGTPPRPSGGGWMCRCPAHEDRNPSLSVKTTNEGKVLLHCFADCPTDAVLAEAGLTWSDLSPISTDVVVSGRPRLKGRQPRHRVTRPPKRDTLAERFETCEEAIAEADRRYGSATARYPYGEGSVLRFERRDGGKFFVPVWRFEDGWGMNAPDAPRPLYRLNELLDADVVAVAEGEKSVDQFRVLGFKATTSMGGAGAPHLSDWSIVAGKEVWIFPDNDDAGRRFAAAVAKLCRAAGARIVRIIRLPGLGEGEDIVEFVALRRGEGRKDTEIAKEIEGMARQAKLKTTTEPRPVEAYQPPPLDALPSSVRSYIEEGAASIGCDSAYLMLPLLSTAGMAFGNARWARAKAEWTEPPILWTAFIGDSGTAKSPAFQFATKPLRTLDDDAFYEYEEAMRQRKAPESEETPGEEPPRWRRFILDDITTAAVAEVLQANPTGGVCLHDELAGLFGSFDRFSKGKDSADEPFYLKLHNGASLMIDRKGEPKHVRIPYASIAVSGGLQPSVARHYLGERRLENGFAQRFLLACPPFAAWKWSDREVRPTTVERMIDVFRRLRSLRMETSAGRFIPRIAPLTESGRAAFVGDYIPKYEAELERVDGALRSACAKFRGQTLRLALVLHYVRWAEGDATIEDADGIDGEDVRRATLLSDWFWREVQRIYAIFEESSGDKRKRELVELIRRKGGQITARELTQATRKLKNVEEAEKTLREMATAGLGSYSVESTGGRPAQRFTLFGDGASDVYVYESTETSEETRVP